MVPGCATTEAGWRPRLFFETCSLSTDLPRGPTPASGKLQLQSGVAGEVLHLLRTGDRFLCFALPYSGAKYHQ